MQVIDLRLDIVQLLIDPEDEIVGSGIGIDGDSGIELFKLIEERCRGAQGVHTTVCGDLEEPAIGAPDAVNRVIAIADGVDRTGR